MPGWGESGWDTDRDRGRDTGRDTVRDRGRDEGNDWDRVKLRKHRLVL